MTLDSKRYVHTTIMLLIRLTVSKSVVLSFSWSVEDRRNIIKNNEFELNGGHKKYIEHF